MNLPFDLLSLAVYIPFCMFLAVWGQKRGAGFGTTFLVSLILTPIAGLLLVLISPKVKAARREPESNAMK